MQDFTKADSFIRVLVAPVAFGVGVHVEELQSCGTLWPSTWCRWLLSREWKDWSKWQTKFCNPSEVSRMLCLKVYNWSSYMYLKPLMSQSKAYQGTPSFLPSFLQWWILFNDFVTHRDWFRNLKVPAMLPAHDGMIVQIQPQMARGNSM